MNTFFSLKSSDMTSGSPFKFNSSNQYKRNPAKPTPNNERGHDLAPSPDNLLGWGVLGRGGSEGLGGGLEDPAVIPHPPGEAGAVEELQQADGEVAAYP